MIQDPRSGLSVDLERVMEILPAAVCMVDTAGRVVRYNRRAAELWGRDPEASAGARKYTGALRLFTPGGEELEEERVPAALALRQGRTVQDEPLVIEQPGGRRLDVLVTAFPLEDGRGGRVGALSCFFDVTPLRRAEAEARHLARSLEERVAERTRDLLERTEQLAVLAQTAQDVLVSTTEEQLLDILCKGARSVLRGDGAVACLRPAASGRDGTSAVWPPAGLWHGDGPPGPAELARQVFSAPEAVREPGPFAADRRTGGPALIVPIHSAAETMAGFVVVFGRERAVQDPDRAIAWQVSRIASIALLRLRAEEAAQKARAELEEFSYAVAHNLRAPLRAMSGFTTILADDYRDRALDDGAQALLARVGEAAHRMDFLIEALLSYTRLTYQRFSLGPVDLQEVVDKALAKTRETAGEKAPTVQVDPLPFTVLGNRILLEEAVQHLLENAFKYSRGLRSPSIRVGAEGRDDGAVRLFVEDDGPGIAPEHQARIFRLFELLRPEKHSGLGVGLPIVRKAVERMNGRSGVVSEPSVGSRFWIELRRAR